MGSSDALSRISFSIRAAQIAVRLAVEPSHSEARLLDSDKLGASSELSRFSVVGSQIDQRVCLS